MAVEIFASTQIEKKQRMSAMRVRTQHLDAVAKVRKGPFVAPTDGKTGQMLHRVRGRLRAQPSDILHRRE